MSSIIQNMLRNSRAANIDIGFNWTPNISSLSTAFGSSDINEIIYANNQFIAVGLNGKCATSPDGVNWTNRPGMGNISMQDIHWNPSLGIYVAVGAACYTSPDGVTWTIQPSFTTNVFISGYPAYALAWNGSYYVAVGNQGKCGTSPDGVNWTFRGDFANSSKYGAGPCYTLTWAGDKFVATGNATTSSRAVYSADGITWTQSSSYFGAMGGSTAGYAVAWNGSLLVSGGSNGKIATSPDGINWTYRAAGSTAWGVGDIREIIWTGTEWLASGFNGKIIRSPDGINWTLEADLVNNPFTNSHHVYGLATNGSILVIGGTAGKTAYSNS